MGALMESRQLLETSYWTLNFEQNISLDMPKRLTCKTCKFFFFFFNSLFFESF